MARESYAQTQIPETGKADTPYPDHSKVVNGLLKRLGECQAGTVEGTGEAIDVALDFDPAVVIVWNQDDPTLGIHTPSMTAAHMLKLTDAPALTHATADGITLGTKEFTIGADADLNVSDETLHWVAFGFRE